jgi:hypothetical protein
MLMAGNAYAWCPHMQRAAADCCHGPAGPSSSDQADQDRGPEVESPCCESRVVNELPTADRAPTGAFAALQAPPLPEPVVLEPPAPTFVVREVERTRVRTPIRAGPRTALERCVLLQTFLH